jgi:CRP-like cAMP-binding protein
MGFNVTWLTAHEESLVDDNLLSVGRRSAQERIATLLIQLYKRMAALHHGTSSQDGVPFPLTQQHIADSLGLSLVHTNKTLRKLEKLGLHHIEGGRLYLRDVKALERMADLYGDGRPPQRPLV